MSRQAYFSQQLSAWLVQADWHFNTLLATTIECVSELPADCDALINDLLLEHSTKPSQQSISAHLTASSRLSNWFKHDNTAPAIKRFNLTPLKSGPPASDRLPIINTVGDLAQWLSISISELDWFANLWRRDLCTPQRLQHYHYQVINKRGGGSRLIEQPKTRLKQLQQQINKGILSALDTHPAAHGFCRGKNCLSHASLHTGKRYLLTYDIAECFHSITWKRVNSIFYRLGYTGSVAHYLTALCTHSVHPVRSQLKRFDTAQRERLKQRHLPQGAPTSPALANAALLTLDLRLSGLAQSLDLDYSRYADDIAMSGNAHRDWRFLELLVGSICIDEGVALNYKKTRIKRSHQKQRLVGIVVNQKTNIDRRYFDELKAILTNCKRHGIASQNRLKHPQFRAHLFGRIQYVKSLNPQKALKLERIFNEIDC